MSLPLRLPGETMTRIIEMKVSEHLDKFNDRVHQVIPDGVFPGTKDAPGPARLDNYIAMTTSVQDLALLALPNYVELLQQGQVPPLQSPRWATALSVPDTFREMQRDFMRLLQKAVEP